MTRRPTAPAVRPALCAALLATAACAPMAGEGERADASVVPAGEVTGEAVSCIPIRSIRSSRVHGDDTIDFEVGNGRIYRNVLPNRCYSLGFEERFAYETSLSNCAAPTRSPCCIRTGRAA